MPVVAIPPGPIISMNQGEVYALPGCKCRITSGVLVQRSDTYAGTFTNWTGSPTGVVNNVGGFIKCATGATTVVAVRAKLNGTF